MQYLRRLPPRGYVLACRIWPAYPFQLFARMASGLAQLDRAGDVGEGLALIGQLLSGWEHTEVPLGRFKDSIYG